MKNGVILRQLVRLSESPDDCWEWIGTVSGSTGYGKKTFHKKTVLAHRWIYEIFVGPIPTGLVINHKCSNRLCVNPYHLELTDQAGNCRHGKGTKLSDNDVRDIKSAKHSKCWGDGARLARKYNVSCALIHDIWNDRAWSKL